MKKDFVKTISTVHTSCVRSCLIWSSKTWSIKVAHEVTKLDINEHDQIDECVYYSKLSRKIETNVQNSQYYQPWNQSFSCKKGETTYLLFFHFVCNAISAYSISRLVIRA